MRKLKSNDVAQISVEDWELEKFAVFEPNENSADYKLHDKSVLVVSKSDKYVFCERDTSTRVMKVQGYLNDDECILVHDHYEYYALNENEFKQYEIWFKEFYETYEAEKIKAQDKGYRQYYGRDEYDMSLTHQENMNRIESFKKSVKKWEEDKIAQTEVTQEMQRLAQEFNELGVYRNSILTIYKDEIKIKDNTCFGHPVQILMHHHFKGSAIAKLDRELKQYAENHEYKLDQLSRFLMDYDFTMMWNNDSIEHTVHGEQFRIKHKKTNRWAKGGEMHRSIMNIRTFDDSLLILDFYENSNKPAGEYYNKIAFDEGKTGHTLPATFKRVQGNEYEITIMDGITIKQNLYITNNKKQAFEQIKNKNFTHTLSMKTLYKDLIQTMDKATALHNIKTLKALLNI